MGVAGQVAAPDCRWHARTPSWAWTEAGEQPHVVRVRYPIRPGYGQHPVKIGIVGFVAFIAGRWARGQLHQHRRR